MDVIKGTLRLGEAGPFLETENGDRLLETEKIWDGYITHWLNQPVCARYLHQKDYESGQPILVLWPDRLPQGEPFVEVYFNERLIKYSASFFGHNAINVNGEIFNFSHLINENEIMDVAEYFYRPALGEFAPSPHSGRFEVLSDGRAFYDKFGRNFMRTIHVLRIEGMDVKKLSDLYHHQLERIRNTPPDPADPEKYRDFSFFTRSCTTIIRDGLTDYGLGGFGGIFPRDFFTSLGYALFKNKEQWGVRVQYHRLPQLKVPEAPYSAMTPLMNPANWVKQKLAFALS